MRLHFFSCTESPQIFTVYNTQLATSNEDCLNIVNNATRTLTTDIYCVDSKGNNQTPVSCTEPVQIRLD